MPFCSKCGSQIGEGDLFCGKCGAKIVQAAPKPVVSTVIGMSGWAIAALVLGILGFLVRPLSIGAIICGILGISETGVGEKRGRGMAIAGLVLGCIIWVAWIIGIFTRTFVLRKWLWW